MVMSNKVLTAKAYMWGLIDKQGRAYVTGKNGKPDLYNTRAQAERGALEDGASEVVKVRVIVEYPRSRGRMNGKANQH